MANPPQTTIRRPVQTAVWRNRGEGSEVVETGLQASAKGSYRPPASGYTVVPPGVVLMPPQMIISVPVHTAECWARGAGAPALETGAQVSVAGSYRPPLSRPPPVSPPQTIICEPVHTAV